jgi:hypothetical protein
MGTTSRGFVLYGHLAKAVRLEAAVVICHWWGVAPNTVSRWRRALGVGRKTEGGHALWSAYTREEWAVAARAKGRAKAKSPEALAKLSASLRGRRLSDHTKQALRRARLGTKHSDETRQKIAEATRLHGRLPRGMRPWTKQEDALLRRLPATELLGAQSAPFEPFTSGAGCWVCRMADGERAARRAGGRRSMPKAGDPGELRTVDSVRAVKTASRNTTEDGDACTLASPAPRAA